MKKQSDKKKGRAGKVPEDLPFHQAADRFPAGYRGRLTAQREAIHDSIDALASPINTDNVELRQAIDAFALCAFNAGQKVMKNVPAPQVHDDPRAVPARSRYT